MVRVASEGSGSTIIATDIKSEDVEVDQDGNIIVLQELGGGQLLKITPGGTITTILTGLIAPVDLVIEVDGSIVVAEYGGTLKRITPDGSSVTVLATGLSTVEGVALQPSGSFLVSQIGLGQLIGVANDGSSEGVFFGGLSGPDHLTVRQSHPN